MQVDPPLRPPVVVAAHHQARRPLAGDHRRDGVEEAAQRVDRPPSGAVIDEGTPKNERNHMLAPSSSNTGADTVTDSSVRYDLRVDRIDHVVLNCRDVDAHRLVRAGARHEREVFGEGRVACGSETRRSTCGPRAPNWGRAVDAPGSLDLCFIAEMSPDDVGAHLRLRCDITEGPSPRRCAGPDDVALLPRPDGNLIEVASYSAPD